MFCGLSLGRWRHQPPGAVSNVESKVEAFEAWASRLGRCRMSAQGREYQVVVEHMVLPHWFSTKSDIVIKNCLSKEILNLVSGNLVESVELLERVNETTWIEATRYRGIGYLQPPRENCLVYHRPHQTCYIAFTPDIKRVGRESCDHVLISGLDIHYQSNGERLCRYVNVATRVSESNYFDLIGIL